MVKVNRYTPDKEKSKESSVSILYDKNNSNKNIRGDKEGHFETLRCHKNI